jgi:hypothetical protein
VADFVLASGGRPAIASRTDSRQSFLWSLLIGLTCLILLYPFEPRSDPVPILAPDLFPSLTAFGIIFYAWTLVLMTLLLSDRRSERNDWRFLFLVVVGALVFRGFWNIKVPLLGQAYQHANAAEAWLMIGRIAPHPAAAYLDWPGVSLEIMTLSEIAGLNMVLAVAAISLFLTATIGIATYVLMRRILGRGFYAAVAALLVIFGNLASIVYLTAGPATIPLVVLFLALLFRSGGQTSGPADAVSLISLAGAAVTHFHSAMHFFFLALGALVLRLGGKARPSDRTSPIVLFLMFAVPIAWLLFWAVTALAWLSRESWALISHPLDIIRKQAGVYTVAQANFGEVVPMWYRLTRLIWLGLLYAPAAIIWPAMLWRWRSLQPNDRTMVGAFLGLAVLGVLSGWVSPRGFGELLRSLTYVPFFTAPLIFLWLRGVGRMVRRAGILLLIAVTSVFALPTFMANNHRVNMLAPYESERAAGRWLSLQYKTGGGVHVFLTHPLFGTIQSHLLDASYQADREAESTGYTGESRWNAIDQLLDAFLAPRGPQPRFFIHSMKIAIVSNLTFNLPLDDPRWGRIPARLSAASHKVYDNGPLHVYAGE